MCVNRKELLMFENFKKITIKGGYFDTDKEFQVFYETPIGVVYGRNGSGKTTIAKGFRELAKTADQLKKESEEGIIQEYTVSSTPAVPDANKAQIFVFDEDFVREKVRVDNSDELAAIVMLGDQGEIDEQIKKKNEELKLVNANLGILAGIKGEYENGSNPKSPTYQFGAIKQFLQSDGGWADIDRDVKENATKSSVTPRTLESFLQMEEPTETEEVLKQQLQDDYKVYMNTESTASIVWTYKVLTCPDSLDDLTKVLQEHVEKPELNDREKRLLAFLTEHAQGNTKQLIDEEWAFCPTCLREVKEEDRSSIVETLTKLLNEKAKAYKAKLEAELERFKPLVVASPAFPKGLHQEVLKDMQMALFDLNQLLVQVTGRINESNNKLYEALEQPFEEGFTDKYATCLTAFKTKLAEVKKLVEDYNKLVSDLGKLKKKVLDENKKLARKQLANELTLYSQAVLDAAKAVNDWTAKDNERKALEAGIADLITKKKNTEIALDYINLELQYVFYSNKKVKLVPCTDGNYKLQVNGKNVRPNKISVGERNVLGLCYFFASLFSGKEKEKKYQDEQLIVIDDPVSSFDHGNRVGVMSLLHYQFSSILKGNANSRILVMSHDLHSIFDLQKIKKELCEDISGKAKEECKGYLELEKKMMERKTSDNEYKKLVQFVYEYCTVDRANGAKPEEALEAGIGNMMRKMLEAYSSFCYSETFEKMVRREEVLKQIEEHKRSYYENFMYRLALNGESHMAEQVYTLDDMVAFFTPEEKLQTAKSLLLFMYYINKPHLEVYLGKDADQKLLEIESWQTEEKDWLLGDRGTVL